MPADHLPSAPNLAQSADVAAATGFTSCRVDAAPSHEEIAVEAEVLWRQEGCPHDRDDAIWLQAERQLFQVARAFRDVQDEKALLDPISRLNPKSDDVMEELNEIFLPPDSSQPLLP